MPSPQAKNIADKLSGGVSTTQAGGNSPTVSNFGAGLSKEDSNMLSREISYGADKGDLEAQNLMEDERQIAGAEAQKGIQGLSFARTLGDLRNRIHQRKLDEREKLAQSGFSGSGNEVRNQIQLNNEVENTLGDRENEYLNNLRGLNAQIGSARDDELNKGKKYIASGIGKMVGTGQFGKGLYDMENQEGFFTKHIGSIFGADQTSIAKLNTEKFMNNEKAQNMMRRFGVNPKSPDFANQVKEALSKELQTVETNIWNGRTEIKFDSGDGLKTVDTKYGDLWHNIWTGALRTTGLAAIFVPVVGGAISGASGLIGGALADAAVNGTLDMAIGDVVAGIGEELAGESVTDSIGGFLTDSIAGEVDGLSADFGTKMSSMLTETFGEEALSGISSSTLSAAENMAIKTAQSLATDGVVGTAEEEAVIGMVGKMLMEDEALSSTASAVAGETAEAVGAAETGEAVGAAEGAEATGVSEGTTAGVSGTEESAGITNANEAAGATEEGSGIAAKWERFKSSKGMQVFKGISKAIKEVAIKGPAKAIWRNKIAVALGITTIAAGKIIESIADIGNKHELSDDTLAKIAFDLAEDSKIKDEKRG